MSSTSTRLMAIASAIGVFAAGAPVAGAAAATGSAPAAALPSFTLPPLPTFLGTWPSSFTFVPPAGPAISVVIGPIIIDGQVISPGLRVTKPAVKLPPIVVGQG